MYATPSLLPLRWLFRCSSLHAIVTTMPRPLPHPLLLPPHCHTYPCHSPPPPHPPHHIHHHTTAHPPPTAAPLLSPVAASLQRINEAVAGGDPDATAEALMDEYAQLRNVDPNLADRYLAALQKAMEGREEGLSFEEIQAIIDEVNEQVRRERLCECCVLHICQNDL